MGLDRIDEALQQLGVSEIICEGQPFDPRKMNAVDVEETVDVPDGIVLEVYRTGYMIDANVLQPARVKVARAPEQKDEALSS
jgi:molecular chaperone GrpE